MSDSGNSAVCAICGRVEVTEQYPNAVCRECDAKAVNRDNEKAMHAYPPESGAKLIYEADNGDNPVYIDGIKCWRRYRFGGHVTMRDKARCDSLPEFLETVVKPYARHKSKLPLTRLAYKRKPGKCPFCGSDRIVGILYGMPAPEAREQAMRGEIVLGGCCVSPGDPKWQCIDCDLELFQYPCIVRDDYMVPVYLYGLYRDIGWSTPIEKCEDDLEHSYANFSCRIENTLVGVLLAVGGAGGDVLFTNLVVCPEWQGKGIGTALVQTAMRELAKDGIKRFNAVFEPEIEPFFQKCGMSIMKGGVADLHGVKPV